MKKKKPTQGGKRRGAGRPYLGAERVNISITPEDKATVAAAGSGKLSVGIRVLAEQERANQEAAARHG